MLGEGVLWMMSLHSLLPSCLRILAGRFDYGWEKRPRPRYCRRRLMEWGAR